MLLTDQGLKIHAFNPIVAGILGNVKGEEGSKVLSEAISHGRTKILLRDWVYCLAKATSSNLHKRFILRQGKSIEEFITILEEGLSDDETEFGIPPVRVTSSCVEGPVMKAMDNTENMARKYQMERIDDAVLTISLLKNADDDLKDLLESWIGQDQYKSFLASLNRQVVRGKVPVLFDDKGRMKAEYFMASGKKSLKRLIEDAASLGVKKISVRHMLYSLLGDEASLLSRTLTNMGVDVKRDLHALLSRELTRPSIKRVELLEPTIENMMDNVIKVFEQAHESAYRREEHGIIEHDISLAFVIKQSREVTRLMAGKKSVDIPNLRTIMDETDPDSEEEDDRRVKEISAAEIEKQIKDRIKGQDVAVQRVMPWIKRLHFGIPRDGRPAGVFLFLGPTGTGKTQLAKELARYVFGDEDMLIFMEMGQFKTKESMNMFIGAPPGYIGYGDGKLTNGLRDNPESVVLFDEIEKADTQVFDTLLRFADEGFISDPAGPVRDGRKCLIVMTTNAGQTWLRNRIQEDPSILLNTNSLTEDLFKAAMDELSKSGFRPEFLGRLDERITFLPLTEKVCREIVDLVLTKEIAKFRDLKGVEISVDDNARPVLAKFAHKRSMEEGARGAPRAVNDFIVTPVIDILSDMKATGEKLEGKKLNATSQGLDKVVLEVMK